MGNHLNQYRIEEWYFKDYPSSQALVMKVKVFWNVVVLFFCGVWFSYYVNNQMCTLRLCFISNMFHPSWVIKKECY